jgi:SAM-dependent methyltransferase
MTEKFARFYDELAHWWPLFSPPSHYGPEADDLLPRLRFQATSTPPTLLELGSGGGSLAFHLKQRFRCTLTDRSTSMLAVNRAVNPECEHQVGDMRTLRLGRQFDVVLIHDAVMYLTTPADVVAALETAALHCRPAGAVMVVPDCVRETFEPATSHGGEDGGDGRALRYLQWQWDPDPTDDTYVVDYAFVLRDPDGSVTVQHDRHVEGLYPRARWLRWFAEVGLAAHAERDQWGRDVMVATPTDRPLDQATR